MEPIPRKAYIGLQPQLSIMHSQSCEVRSILLLVVLKRPTLSLTGLLPVCLLCKIEESVTWNIRYRYQPWRQTNPGYGFSAFCPILE